MGSHFLRQNSRKAFKLEGQGKNALYSKIRKLNNAFVVFFEILSSSMFYTPTIRSFTTVISADGILIV